MTNIDCCILRIYGLTTRVKSKYTMDVINVDKYILKPFITRFFH